jgi:hypothetical protein
MTAVIQLGYYRLDSRERDIVKDINIRLALLTVLLLV